MKENRLEKINTFLVETAYGLLKLLFIVLGLLFILVLFYIFILVLTNLITLFQERDIRSLLEVAKSLAIIFVGWYTVQGLIQLFKYLERGEKSERAF